jgi:hypothetical protein
MKRTATALTLISTLLFSTVAGAQFVNLAAANFLPADLSFAQIFIISPENKTYTGKVDVIFIASYNNLTLQSLSCVIDDEASVEINSDSYRVLFQSPDGTVEMRGALLLALDDGPHKLTVHAKMARLPLDPVCAEVPQYVDYSDVVYFTVDSIPPNVSILAPVDKTYNTAEVRLDFTVNEPVSWMGYSIDGLTSVTLTGNTTLRSQVEGMFSLTVYARDAAGNLGISEPVNFAIDTISPRFSLLSPENKTYAAGDISLNLTVNEAISQITYSLDGQENVTIAGNTTLAGLSYGSHRLTVYATDTAGNTGVSETVYFSIEPFPTTLVAVAVMSAASAGASLLLYFGKRKKLSQNTSSIRAWKRLVHKRVLFA